MSEVVPKPLVTVPLLGLNTMLKSNDCGACVTVKVKVAVLTKLPLVPITAIL